MNRTWKSFTNGPLAKPLVLIVLFGSQVINLIDIKKEKTAMESLYRSKINLLQQSLTTPADPIKLARINRQIKNRQFLRNKNYDAIEQLGEEDLSKILTAAAASTASFPTTSSSPEQKVEKIIIKDEPGAFQNAAADRKISKFL